MVFTLVGIPDLYTRLCETPIGGVQNEGGGVERLDQPEINTAPKVRQY
jgi:hypothetical protein